MVEGNEDETADSGEFLKAGSTDSQAIADYYDDWAGSYDSDLKDWNYQAPMEAATALVKHLQAGERVLDAGCGTGMFGQALSGLLDCRIEGIDISTASLEIAEKSNSYASLQQVDLQALPLPLADNSFDAAASVGVMTYIEDAAGLLTDLCRIVRPGGHIFFTQRDDRWQELGFDGLLRELEEQGLWRRVEVSDARPYLPENKDFADAIRVIEVLCQVA